MRLSYEILFSLYNRYGTKFSAVVLCILVLSIADKSYAQQSEVSQTAEPETKEEVPIKRTLDLGRFQMHENRPTSNVTAKVTFEVHLSLHESVDEDLFLMLERWKHRLRDQVITAARKTETQDFVEPNLHIFRRNVLLRINRLLKLHFVDEVYVTEYSFTTH